jgi:hypothetical protein
MIKNFDSTSTASLDPIMKVNIGINFSSNNNQLQDDTELRNQFNNLIDNLKINSLNDTKVTSEAWNNYSKLRCVFNLEVEI